MPVRVLTLRTMPGTPDSGSVRLAASRTHQAPLTRQQLGDTEVEDLGALAPAASGSATSMMLSGLRSRWTIRRLCVAESPEASWRISRPAGLPQIALG